MTTKKQPMIYYTDGYGEKYAVCSKCFRTFYITLVCDEFSGNILDTFAEQEMKLPENCKKLTDSLPSFYCCAQ